MSQHSNYHHNLLTEKEIRIAAVEAASRIFQERGRESLEIFEDNFFRLSNRIAKYIETGEKPQ